MKMKNKKFLIVGALLFFVSALGFMEVSSNSETPLQNGLVSTPFAENGDAEKAIIETVENSYDIQAEAAYTGDLSKFPTVFINDPRFELDPYTLQVVREMTNQPDLKSGGWLDYKMAYYSWRINSTRHAEELRATAKAENRDLTEAEKASLVDPYGRSAPMPAQDGVNDLTLTFMSVEVKEDVATVVYSDGVVEAELTIVLVDGRWYIAAFKGLKIVF
jgi:hypothetical protein